MNKKQIILRRKLQALNPAHLIEYTMPGEPMIYSTNTPRGYSKDAGPRIRNQKYRSHLKCFFPNYNVTSIPVVIIVRFYVTPPEYIKLSRAELKAEKKPAVFPYEICDYILSFQETLYGALINSYAQVVRLDAEKYYSSNPRTVFQFVKYDIYEQLQATNPILTTPESLCPDGDKRCLQSFLSWDETGKPLRASTYKLPGEEGFVGTPPSDIPLPDASSKTAGWLQKTVARIKAPLQKAGRRQPGEVPE